MRTISDHRGILSSFTFNKRKENSLLQHLAIQNLPRFVLATHVYNNDSFKTFPLCSPLSNLLDYAYSQEQIKVSDIIFQTQN